MIEQQDDGALKRMLIEISQSKAALEGLIFFHGTPETPTPSSNCPAGLQRYVTRGRVSLPYLQALYFIPLSHPPSLSHSCNRFSWSVTFLAACETIEHQRNYRLPYITSTFEFIKVHRKLVEMLSFESQYSLNYI